MVPPLPAASRPSNNTAIRLLFSCTQRCILTISTCSARSSRSYLKTALILPISKCFSSSKPKNSLESVSCCNSSALRDGAGSVGVSVWTGSRFIAADLAILESFRKKMPTISQANTPSQRHLTPERFVRMLLRESLVLERAIYALVRGRKSGNRKTAGLTPVLLSHTIAGNLARQGELFFYPEQWRERPDEAAATCGSHRPLPRNSCLVPNPPRWSLGTAKTPGERWKKGVPYGPSSSRAEGGFLVWTLPVWLF